MASWFRSPRHRPRPTQNAVRFKRPEQFRYIGKDIPIVDLVTDHHRQSDLRHRREEPGMLYACIERPPFIGSTLTNCDDSAAKQVKGVQQVVMLDAREAALRVQAAGRRRGDREQQLGGAAGPQETEDRLERRRKRAPTTRPRTRPQLLDTVKKPGRVARETGNVDAEFAKGGKIVEASYYTPMLAHAPMEPPAAVAEFKDGKVEIWAATQNPQAVQDTVAKALGIGRNDVTLPRDAARRRIRTQVEARLRGRGRAPLQAGREAREDRLEPRRRHAFRLLPLARGDVHEGGGRRERDCRRRGCSAARFRRSRRRTILAEQYGGFQLGMGWTDIPYPIPNLRVENGPAQAHFRIGWLRSVSNIYHAFARAVVYRRTGRCGRSRSRRVSARHHRAAASDRFREGGTQADRAAESEVPVRHRPAAQRDRPGGRSSRAGQTRSRCRAGRSASRRTAAF